MKQSPPAVPAAPPRGPVQLNLGCGPVQPTGWINFDGSNRAWLASRLPWLDRLLVWLRLIPATEFGPHTRTADLRKPLPFANDAVDAIYSGEMLEHFTQEQGERFLAECFRVLRPGGVLRVRVPDNYRFWASYVAEVEQMQARPREEWEDQHTRWITMFFRDICTQRSWLHSMGHYHKWMYDEVSLVLALERAGFVEVERRALHVSRIKSVSLVETRDDLIVEGVKPV